MCEGVLKAGSLGLVCCLLGYLYGFCMPCLGAGLEKSCSIVEVAYMMHSNRSSGSCTRCNIDLAQVKGKSLIQTRGTSFSKLTLLLPLLVRVSIFHFLFSLSLFTLTPYPSTTSTFNLNLTSDQIPRKTPRLNSDTNIVSEDLNCRSWS